MAIKNPFDISIEDIGEQNVELDEPIEVMEVRRLIGLILEDAFGFIDDAASAQLAGSIPQTSGYERFSWLESSAGRKLKKLFNKHADHEFLRTLNTVHWTGDEYALKYLMDAKSNDELSTTISKAGEPFVKPPRVSYGLWIKGWISFAANDMDNIFSGHVQDYMPQGWNSSDWTEENITKAKHRQASSGINKVPQKAKQNWGRWQNKKEDSMYSEKPYRAQQRILKRFPYILDDTTFNTIPHKVNEALVDNWKPVGIIVTDEWMVKNVGTIPNPGRHHGLRLGKLFAVQEHWNVPLYDIEGNKLLDSPPQQGWPNPEEQNE